MRVSDPSERRALVAIEKILNQYNIPLLKFFKTSIVGPGDFSNMPQESVVRDPVLSFLIILYTSITLQERISHLMVPQCQNSDVHRSGHEKVTRYRLGLIHQGVDISPFFR